MQHDLVADPWVQADGRLTLRPVPALGVEIREEAVRKYRLG